MRSVNTKGQSSLVGANFDTSKYSLHAGRGDYSDCKLSAYPIFTSFLDMWKQYSQSEYRNEKLERNMNEIL